MSVDIIATDEFDRRVLQRKDPVLVDFFGPSCAPCKLLAPVLDDLAASQDAMSIVKVDVDASPDIARAYGVRSIPVLKVFVDGAVVKTIIGAKPKSILVSVLADFLG